MNPIKQRISSKDEYILSPGVLERAAGKSGRELTDQERRARELVESIERDLFGSKSTPVYETDEEKNEAPLTAVDVQDEGSVSEVTVEAADTQKKSDVHVPEVAPELEEHTIVEKAEPQPPAADAEDDDFRFLMDMDYEGELGDSVGFERIRAYRESQVNGRSVPRGMKHPEFEIQLQEQSFRREYNEQRLGKILRLACSVLMLIMILLYERAGLMARMFGGIVDGEQYPVAYILIGVQLLLLDAALFAKPIWTGLMRLFRFSPVDYSFASVLVIATFVYHYILLITPSEGVAPVLYLSPAALSLALLAVKEFLDWYRESLVYDVVASRHQKYALVSRISVGAARDGARARMDDYGIGKKEYYARPVDFVRNYFTNTAKRAQHHRYLGAHMLAIFALGSALGIVVFVRSSDVSFAFCAVFATILLGAPFTSLLLAAVPMFFSTAFRQRGKSAIVGERPVEECATPATVVLPDNEIFLSMEHDQLRLENGCDIHAISALTNALLKKIGSPLAAAFSVDESSRISPDRLHLVELDDTGVSAQLDENGPTIVFGTVPFVREKGITVRHLAEDIPGHVYKRLYAVAVDGKTAAIFLVRYQLRHHVPAFLREMKRVGVPVALRTQDPCVRAEIVKQILGPTLSMDVIKPSLQEVEIATSRVDATIVALDSCCEVARAYAACRLVSRAGAFGKCMQVISLVLGALLATALVILGTIPSALLITLWLLLWCGLYAIVSYFLLDRNEEQVKQKTKKRST